MSRTRPAPTTPGVLATIRATPTPVRYLLGGVLINQLGAFVQTFLVLYLAYRGMSLADAGLALTAYSAGAVLGGLLGGELTERIGPRTTIAAAMGASALIVALVPELSRPSSFAALLLATALAGLVTQAYRPAAACLLSELMPEESRVMGFSMMRIAMNTGAAVSPLIAAGLILVDWDAMFWLDAATALAYAALAYTLLPELPRAAARSGEPAGGAEAPASAAGWRSTYAALLRDRRYLAFLVSVLLGAMIYVQYTVALPLKLRADGFPSGMYSAVLTVSSLILIACELKITAYVKRWKGYLVGAAGTALMGLGTAGYVTHSAAFVIVSAALFVFGVMVSGPTMFAYPATFPGAVKARYVAAHQAVFGLGMALGPTVGVFAWGVLHNGIWPVCGVLGLVAGLCAQEGMRPRPEPEPEPEPAAAPATVSAV